MKSFKEHAVHTNFLHQLIDLFETNYDRENLSFMIPQYLKEIQDKAAGAEMNTKNSI